MKLGYTGKILHIDLSAGKLKVETPPESFYRKYYGGSALGLYYLLRNTPAGADPLGPENTLVLAVSGLTGIPISGQSRLTATAKSPLTGAVGDSQVGGFFPARMKWAGFDALVFSGEAQGPVYLWVSEGKAELRPADHLWGKTTGEVEDLLQDELEDSRIEVLQTGPAGEKLVRFAAGITYANRALGRTGMGAVMGSKRLKAVVVQGDQKPETADQDALQELARRGARYYPESGIYSTGEMGTAVAVQYQQLVGGLPTRNWDSGVFEGYQALDGETMTETILKKRDTCYSCVVRCKRVVEVEGEPYRVEARYGGPEYESVAALGSYCGVDDLEAVSYANQLCNMYGMDTLSCGGTIAWAMDCFQNGLITEQDTGGMKLAYGDADVMVTLVEQIARREGLGDLLAEGSARAAEQFGPEAEARVVAVKKMEYPAHMPQVKRSLGLIYAVNPFGADHESSEHDPSYQGFPDRMEQIGLTDPQPGNVLNEEKVRFALVTQYLYSCMSCLNVCNFVFGPSWQLYDTEELVETVRAVMGWDVTVPELLEVGRRRLNMQRAFNAREGIGRAEDTLPSKLEKALKGGKTDGERFTVRELEQAKDIYYRLAGWDLETGYPRRETLEELGLNWLDGIQADR